MNSHPRSFAFLNSHWFCHYFAIKHQLKVSKAFACSDFATAICTITVQHSLGSTSLSDVCAALQAGPSLKISTGYFLYALSSCGYGFILDITQERASGFHSLPHADRQMMHM
jgi:hypothetical protein